MVSKIPGRLNVCSKSVVFVPGDQMLPMLRMPFVQCDEAVWVCPGGGRRGGPHGGHLYPQESLQCSWAGWRAARLGRGGAAHLGGADRETVSSHLSTAGHRTGQNRESLHSLPLDSRLGTLAALDQHLPRRDRQLQFGQFQGWRHRVEPGGGEQDRAV